MSALEEAKSNLITDYLSSIGFKPTRETTGRAWFLSPLHAETQASFVVKKISNTWEDYSTKAHGDLIDFVEAYDEVTTSEAIKLINGGERSMRTYDPEAWKNHVKEGITVDTLGAITASPLKEYLKERCITEEVYNKHCVQAKWQFTTNPSSWNYGIAFRNDSDGLEIRSKDFKVGNSPKTYRTIGEYTPECNVFEGFFDYMSVLCEHNTLHLRNQTYILNSLAFVHILIDTFKGYEGVNLFIDNDPAGDDKVRVMRDEGIVVKDMRHLFKGHEDYNDYWIDKCKAIK